MIGSVQSGATLPQQSGDKLWQQAKELEGVFLNTLMKQMFSSIDARSGFGGGFAEETWRSMQAEQYAQSLAQSGGIGLADQIVGQLADQQNAVTAADMAPAIAAYTTKGTSAQ